MSYTLEQQKANRAKLVEALRSGRYTQQRERLRGPDGFCCLGVACDISGLGRWVKEPDGHWAYSVHEILDECGMPPDIKIYYGFLDSLGTWVNGDTPVDLKDREGLYKRNDSGSTFDEIADIIEQEPEGLVVK